MRRGSRKMSFRPRGLTGERFGEYRETGGGSEKWVVGCVRL